MVLLDRDDFVFVAGRRPFVRAEHERNAWAVNIAIAQTDTGFCLLERQREVRGDGRFADTAFAARHCDDVFDSWNPLRANARALRRALSAEGFAVADDDMPIVPLVLGDERAAMEMCQAAIEGGVFAQAIRPPTVPAGTSRLRLAAMASHTSADMVKAASVLAAAARELALDPAAIGPPPSRLPTDQQTAADHEREEAALYEPQALSSSVPFDHEQGTPPEHAPFDHERDGEFARAA